MIREPFLRKALLLTTALSFFVPLIVLPQSFIFPFIVPKIVVFRILSIVMLVLFLLLLTIDWKSYRPRLSALNITVGLFFLSLIISTFTGVDWYRSMWDGHERMLGLFTLLHYGLFYLILTSTVREKEEWYQLMRVFLIAGSIVMIIGVFQRIPRYADILLNRGATRVSATLGNSIYYSGYGLFLFLISGYLWLQERTHTRAAWWYIVSGVLGLAGLFLGGTRGAFLGLIAAFGIGIALYAIFLKHAPNVRKVLIGLTATGIVLFALFFAFRQSTVVQDLPIISRLANMSLTEGTSRTRIMAWEIAIESWKEKPIFGWGPNNFYFAFNEHYRPEFLEFGYQETWFDNAHSSVFNTLATQGFVGLLAYLAIFIVSGIVVLRAYKRGVFALHDMVFVSVFLVSHFVATFFVFENPTSYLYYFFVLAFLQQQTRSKRAPSEGKRTQLQSASYGLVAFFVIFFGIFVYATDINPAKANMQTLDAIRSLNTDPTEFFTFMEKGPASPTPHIDDIRNDLIRTALGVFPSLKSAGMTSENVLAAMQTMFGMIEKNKERHPLDVRVQLVEVQIWQTAATSGYLAQEQVPEKTIPVLQKALELSPDRQQIQFQLAGMYQTVGEYDKAEPLLLEARDNDPQIVEAWWRLALLYDAKGDHDGAVGVIHEAEEQGLSFDEDNALQVKQAILSSSTSS